MEDEPQLPDWVIEELENPVAMGEGRNDQMIRIGPTMLRYGMDPEALEEKFCEMYDGLGPQQFREIHAVVRNAVKLAAREQKEINKTQYGKRKLELSRMQLTARQALPMILERYTWSAAEIREHGDPFAGIVGEPISVQRRLFLERMFEPDDVVWIGAVWETGKPKHKGRFLQIRSWLDFHRISGEFCSHSTFKPGSFSRCNENVETRKYLVVESDVLTPDEVGAVFNYLASEQGLELRAVVSTGGKSLHGWFNWPGEEFLDEWSAKLMGWKCDPSTMRPSQPVRLPGIIRAKTKRPQELLYLS